MKLWKSLKVGIGKEQGPGATSPAHWGPPYELDVFKSQSSLSTDSGLCTERGVRRARVELLKPPGRSIGLKLAGRSEPGMSPVVTGFTADGVAGASDRLAPGDRLVAVNGIATAGLTNDELLRLLDNVAERADIDIDYYMPNYASQNSLYVTTKVADVVVERDEGGSLGLTVRGGAAAGGSAGGAGGLVLDSRALDAPPLVVTHVRPGGPAYRTSRVKPGDRLLQVDHVPVTNKTLAEVHALLSGAGGGAGGGGGRVVLTLEYDVSVMDSVRLATGPLLVEIERPCGEDLGLVLVQRPDDLYGTGDTYTRQPAPGLYIDSVLPATISDRCGALHAGDQVLAFDEHAADGGYSADEVMRYLARADAGFTRLHVAPRHILPHAPSLLRENSMSGACTLNPKKLRPRNYRQTSMPKLGLHDDYGRYNASSGGVCRTEVVTLTLEVPPGHSSGLAVTPDGPHLTVTHVTPHSPAHRSGCVQVRDRVLAINGHAALAADVANEILSRRNDARAPRYLTLSIEFPVCGAVQAASGVYSVRLSRGAGGVGGAGGGGLGVTLAGGGRAPPVVAAVRPGSAAHRSGALHAGDQLLAVNHTPLHDLSLDAAFNILQSSGSDIVTLKVRKPGGGGGGGDGGGGAGEWGAPLHSFSCVETRALVHTACRSPAASPRGSPAPAACPRVFAVELVRADGGALGLTIAGSEDATQPILLSGLVEGGLAEQAGKLRVGDELLSINGESVADKPLSEAIRLLQHSGPRVQLQLCRKRPGSGAGSARESSHSASSPGLSNDSAVGSWDQTPVRTAAPVDTDVIEYAVPDKVRRELPLPDYSLDSSLRCQYVLPDARRRATRDGDRRHIELLTAGMRDCRLHDYLPMGPRPPSPPSPLYENDIAGYGESLRVVLYKDAIYDDYGFSVSDGLYERGVYINRIRAGGPADIVGLLRPYDRILQVNGTRTVEFDCCLTVPLIAAAGDRLEIVVQRAAASREPKPIRLDDASSQSDSSVVTKTI
ncbi:glutamate receptor-interacting protein 2 [Aricia agestis]|uniref:glutamate receptor-interacting protein 2 n=1 Tax=Aricia agestis TaxID=91739 RepID=UPI001C201FDB|nr:glutamate receptor-interacting protein 2 [Aricia agestis]